MEITHKEYNLIRRKPQEYFTLYEEYAGRHKIEPFLANYIEPTVSRQNKEKFRSKRNDRDVTLLPLIKDFVLSLALNDVGDFV